MTRHRARLAVIGLGRIGRLHAKNLAGAVATAELAAVADPLAPLARSIGSLHAVPWSTDAAELVADAGVDGVVIAAPTARHVELVQLAAGAGRHVFCEKPLGFEAQAARRATEACATAGVALQVGFQRRFDPDWLAVKELLDREELGELRLFRSSHRNPGEPDASAPLGDLFADVAIHDLDAARWLGGEIIHLRALARDGTAALMLRFASDALGLIDVSRRAAYGFECSAELVGSRGSARIAHQDQIEVLHDGHARRRLPSDYAQRHSPAYLAELAQFGTTVLGGSAGGPGGEDAVAALTLADLARRAATE